MTFNEITCSSSLYRLILVFIVSDSPSHSHSGIILLACVSESMEVKHAGVSTFIHVPLLPEITPVSVFKVHSKKYECGH